MVQWVRALVLQAGVLNSHPQQPCKKLGRACNPSIKAPETDVACLAASLAEMNFQFSERLLRQNVIEENT